MKFAWNEQSAGWFRDASEYTGYNRELAGILLEHIPLRTTLCDIGCGAGLIDFELAPFFEEITCVDISPEAVSAVSECIREQKLGNVRAICADGLRLTGQWDTVIALFHGGAANLPKYLRLAKDRLILASFTDRRGFGFGDREAEKAFHADGVAEQLDALGINYTLERHSLEYGQPFRTYRDAELFIRAYTEPMPPHELDEYLRKALQKTGRDDFPYYLPRKRNFGLFVISVRDNPDIPGEEAI